MAILGITDWAHSSCFYFNPPAALDAENTEIMVNFWNTQILVDYPTLGQNIYIEMMVSYWNTQSVVQLFQTSDKFSKKIEIMVQYRTCGSLSPNTLN